MSGTQPRNDGALGFLFTAAPNSFLVQGFRVNSDGSLSPVPGSPFTVAAPVRALATIQGVLLVAGEDALHALSVDRQGGFLRQTDSIRTAKITQFATEGSKNSILALSETGVFALQLIREKLLETPASVAGDGLAPPRMAEQSAALDESGQFMYTVDAAKSELGAYRVQDGKLVPLSPATYSIPHGTASIVFVKP